MNDSKALVWDLARPYVPFLAVEEHEEPITDFLWTSSNVIWSVSKDQTFVRQDVTVAGYHPAEFMNTSTVGWNVFGDLTFALPRGESGKARVSETVDGGGDGEKGVVR
jgi:hypothetical protein